MHIDRQRQHGEGEANANARHNPPLIRNEAQRQGKKREGDTGGERSDRTHGRAFVVAEFLLHQMIAGYLAGPEENRARNIKKRGRDIVQGNADNLTDEPVRITENKNSPAAETLDPFS